MRSCILATVVVLSIGFAAIGDGLRSAAADALTLERQGELRYLLRHDCGSCHGMTLRGGLGPSLLPSSLRGKPDAVLLSAVLDGRPGTPMPPWRPLLSDAEAGWLVRLLRTGVATDIE